MLVRLDEELLVATAEEALMQGDDVTAIRRTRHLAPQARLAVLAITLAALAGCAAGPARPDDGRLQVVVAENPWTDLVTAVGGDRIDVSTIISSPDADPHVYTASVDVARRLSSAALVVSNGLGYDGFVDTMLAAAPRDGRVHLVAAAAMRIGGSQDSAREDRASEDRAGEDSGTNPHLWYDLPRVPQMVDAVAAALTRLDPAHAEGYRARAAAWTARLRPVLGRLAALAARAGALSSHPEVASTEPVADYLVRAAGFRDVTPSGFVDAVQNESEPSAASVARLRHLVAGDTLRALVFNTQTGDRLTQQVAAVAKDSGLPVIDVTETVPAGTTYLRWQAAHVDALAAVLP